MDRELNYIYNYIKYIYFNVDELKDKLYLLDLSRRIRNSMPNSSFSEGNLNFYINNFVNQEMNFKKSSSYAKYQSLKSYIYLSLDYYRIFYGKNVTNQDIVIREVMKAITDTYSYEDILEGKCESQIEELIDMHINSKFNVGETITRIPLDVSHIRYDGNGVIDDRIYIKKYITDYLKSMTDLFEFPGDLEILSSMICSDLCKSHIKSDDVLAGEYNSKIESYIRRQAFGIKFTDSFNDVYIEVSRYVMNNHTYMDIGNMEQNIAKEIFSLSKYLVKSGYDGNSVKSGKCSTIMENHLRLDCLKANSKICKDSKLAGKDKDPNKFFLDLRQILDAIKKPIIVAAALGIIGASVAVGASQIDTFESKNVEIFDTYEYPTIPYTSSEEFAAAVEHIVEYYPIYESYGRGYGQICLYRVYESIHGSERDKTYAMDIMINLLKARTQYDEDMQQLYNDIKPYQSYMEYVYDRAKVNDSKLNQDVYSMAVRHYASQVSNYKELNPFSLLNKDDQNAIKYMMNVYGNYMDDYENEFNVLTSESEMRK